MKFYTLKLDYQEFILKCSILVLVYFILPTLRPHCPLCGHAQQSEFSLDKILDIYRSCDNDIYISFGSIYIDGIVLIKQTI